jgi:DNA-binding Lrp family transcriptional regulator
VRVDERLLAKGAGATVAMAVGFVLISAAPGREHEVYNTLLKVSEIVELHPLFGEYDLIAKLEAADFDTLGHVIVNKIRSIEGVVDTKTLTGTKF